VKIGLQDITVVLATFVAVVSTYSFGEAIAAAQVLGKAFWAPLYPTGVFEAATRSSPAFFALMVGGVIAMCFSMAVDLMFNKKHRLVLTVIGLVSFVVMALTINLRLPYKIDQAAIVILSASLLAFIWHERQLSPLVVGLAIAQLGVIIFIGVSLGRDQVLAALENEDRIARVVANGTTYDAARVIRANPTGIIILNDRELLFFPMDKVESISTQPKLPPPR
jgi:hypothetical protein